MLTYHNRSSRRAARVARSQLAVRLALAVYAGLAGAVALRVLVHFFDFPDTVWSVKAILAASAPIVLPFSVLPVAERPVVRSITLSDLTAALILLALPLPFLGRRRRARDERGGLGAS